MKRKAKKPVKARVKKVPKKKVPVVKHVIAVERNLKRLAKLKSNTVIIAYKVVHSDGGPPYYRGRGGTEHKYTVGAIITEPNFNSDRHNDCGAGLNVGTLDWCLKKYTRSVGSYPPRAALTTVAFLPTDIACVPNQTDGKFRLKRLLVVSSKLLNQNDSTPRSLLNTLKRGWLDL